MCLYKTGIILVGVRYHIVVYVASTLCVDMKSEYRTWCVLVQICVHEKAVPKLCDLNVGM